MPRPRIRQLAFAANAAILGVILLMLWRSEYGFDAYYRVRYFRHISPQWYFLQGIESVDGRLMFVQASSTCLTADAARRGTSSEFDDIGMERTDSDTRPSTELSAWRTKQVMHYGFCDRSLWSRLGFYDDWELGYRNPTWLRRAVVPYWAIALPLAVWPATAVGAWMFRRHTKKTT
jgi:hypothetical protein